MWITINKHEQDTWLQRLICVDHRKEPIKQKMTKIEAATKAIVIYNTIKRGDWILIEYSTIGVQTLTTGQRLTHCTVQDWNNHNHNHAESNKCIAPIDWHDNWLSRVLRLHQHNIGYMADGFFTGLMTQPSSTLASGFLPSCAWYLEPMYTTGFIIWPLWACLWHTDVPCQMVLVWTMAKWTHFV